jgi:hypothetical protein
VPCIREWQFYFAASLKSDARRARRARPTVTFCALLLLAALAGAGAGTLSKAVPRVPTKAPAEPPDPEAFKSVFVVDPKFGKDPFFPKSQRLALTLAAEQTGSRVVDVSTNLVLKGLSGSPRRRLAIINTHVLAAGESAEVKADGQTIQFQVLEIRERSVLIQCEGQPPKELFMLRNL